MSGKESGWRKIGKQVPGILWNTCLKTSSPVSKKELRDRVKNSGFWTQILMYNEWTQHQDWTKFE